MTCVFNSLCVCLSFFFCFFYITYVLHLALQRIILKKFMCLVLAFPTLKKTYFAELTRLFFLLFPLIFHLTPVTLLILLMTSFVLWLNTGTSIRGKRVFFLVLIDLRYFLLLLCCRLFRWLSIMYGISKDSRGEAVERERGRWSFVGRS